VAESSGSVRFALRHLRLIEAISPLFYLAPWQKNLVQFFANPTTSASRPTWLHVHLDGVHAHEMNLQSMN
jgi:hypothetical protein